MLHSAQISLSTLTKIKIHSKLLDSNMGCQKGYLQRLILILSCMICNLLILACTSKSETKLKRITRENIPTISSQSNYVTDLKTCALSLDSCLNQCNQVYPYSYLENSDRNNCRDACTDRIQNSDNCYMYYRSSRRNVFRASTTK